MTQKNTIKLDKKDYAILSALDTNSRQPLNAIAKLVRLGKDAVAYRIENLKKEGVIEQFHTLIDVGKLGLHSFRLYLKLRNTTPEQEESIIEFLKRQQAVTWLVTIDGEYDIGMWIVVRSVKEMNTFWKELLEQYGQFIEERNLTTFTKVSYFPKTYLSGKKQNTEEYVFITEPEIPTIDDKDREILKFIAPNARIPLIELAHKTHLTPKTVAVRLRELEKKGSIVGYRTKFDLEKLGYEYFKLHINLNNPTRDNKKKIRAHIKQHPNIIYDNEVLGGDDVEIEIQTRTIQELRNIMNDIRKRFSNTIKTMKHMTFTKEHKYVFYPVIDLAH